MNAALWIAKTGIEAQQFRLSTISNNLANVNNHGFKRLKPVFEDLMYQNMRQTGANNNQDTQLPSGLYRGTGVRSVATVAQHTQGEMVKTDEKSFDMAISGRGFFQIMQNDGQIAYTRAGNFQLDSEGYLVTASGDKLEPPIQIPSQAQSVTIGADGVVSYTEQESIDPIQIGQIETANFVNPAGMNPMGGNRFGESAASGAPLVGIPSSEGRGSVLQGWLESSNVNSSEELVKMIEAERAYEMSSKAIQAADKMMSYLNNTI